MAIEVASLIHQLIAANPQGNTPKSEGDDHLRLIKTCILNSFPNIAGVVNASHTELNHSVGVTSAIQDQINTKAPVNNANLTGNPTTTTPPDGSNNTRIANTRYVDRAFTGAAYPSVAGKEDHMLSNDGSVALWRKAPTIPLTTTLTFQVGQGGDFPDLKTAISEVVAKYYPSVMSTNLNPHVILNIMSGHVVNTRIVASGLNLGWIHITGTDPLTPAYFDRTEYNAPYPLKPGFFPFSGSLFMIVDGVAPVLHQRFDLFNPDVTEFMRDRNHSLMSLISSSATLAPRAGATNGAIGIYAETSSVNLVAELSNSYYYGGMFTGCRKALELNFCNAWAQGLHAVGCEDNAVIVRGGSLYTGGDARVQDCSKSAILVGLGGRVYVSSDTNATGTVDPFFGYEVGTGGTLILSPYGVAGTRSQALNTLTPKGIIFEESI